MPIKELIEKIANFFYLKKPRESSPREITQMLKLGSDLDDGVNNLLNILPKIEQARANILTKFGEKLERLDTSLNEMTEKVDKMKMFPDVGDEELKIIDKIKKVKDEIGAGDIDKESVENYILGLHIAKLVSKDDDITFKPDEQTKERLKKVAEKIIPALIEEKFEELEKKTNTRINELEQKALTDFDPRLFKDLRIIRAQFMGLFWYKKGEYKRALEYFDEIRKKNSDIREAWLNNDAVLGKLGEYKKEIKCYDEALNIDKKYQDALINKGIALIENGENKEAEACFKEAYEIISTKQEIK